MPRRPFSVNQANAMIPTLEEIFERLDALQATWTRHSERLQMLDAMWGGRIQTSTNPDHDEFIAERTQLQKTSQLIDAMVRHELTDQGLRLPAGGLEHGIVDFPTTFEGRWVYLCWHRGEIRLTHWHELDTGFSGRQGITDEHVIAMGRIDAEIPDDAGLDFPPPSHSTD